MRIKIIFRQEKVIIRKHYVACALMECPDVILLDEPINAIDEKGVPKIWEALQEEKQRGALIVIACHDTEELESLADQIITILNTKAFEKDRIFAIEEPLHIKVTWINDSTKKHLTSGRKIMRDSGLSSVRIDNENISNYVKCVLGNI